jgi:aminopeptidase-like protein
MTFQVESTTKSMMQMLHDLTPLNRAVCARGYDEAVRYLGNVLPFKVLSYPSSLKHNGWVIPPSWDVLEARILRDGKIIYDGAAHPVGVIGLSSEFNGRVSLQELQKHLHYDHRNPDSIPFYYRQFFRSWQRDWGFCVPKRLFDQLTPGEYEVLIRTEETPGELKVLEYVHRGTSPYLILLGGNLDHAGVANDGLAGCVVAIEVMRRLAGRKTRLSYSAVLSPGIIGPEFYLAGMEQSERRQILGGYFLEMLGSNTPLAVQDSRNPLATVAHALKASLDGLGIAYRTGAFETIIVNDEYIFENYRIPMVSFSRFPYPQYHSSFDSVEIMSEERLEEAVSALMAAIEVIESSPIVTKRFSGNICLSNPQYDLYMDYGQIALGDTLSEYKRKMRHLMDFIPSLEGPISVRAIADHMGLPESDVLGYLQRWADKGLVDIS